MNVLISQIRILFLLFLLISLTGCATFKFWGDDDVEPIEIQTKAVERTPLNLPDPPSIKPRTPTWYVVTPENVEEVWAKLKEQNADLVLFAVTDDGYEELSVTMAEIRNYIKSQKVIIVKYKEYYEPEKKETK